MMIVAFLDNAIFIYNIYFTNRNIARIEIYEGNYSDSFLIY